MALESTGTDAERPLASVAELAPLLHSAVELADTAVAAVLLADTAVVVVGDSAAAAVAVAVVAPWAKTCLRLAAAIVPGLAAGVATRLADRVRASQLASVLLA